MNENKPWLQKNWYDPNIIEIMEDKKIELSEENLIKAKKALHIIINDQLKSVIEDLFII